MPASEPSPHSPPITLLLAAAHGALFLAAFPPFGAWPCAYVAPAPLAWLAMRARSLRLALAAVFVVQMGLWLWIDRWLVDVTTLGYPLLAAYMAGYALLFVVLVRRLARRRRTRSWPMALVLPVVWVGLEGLRGEALFDGYPWFLLAHPLVEWPVQAQAADLLGAYFVSFLAAGVSGMVIDAARWRIGQLGGRAALVSAVAVVAALGASLAYGAVRLTAPDRGGAPPDARMLLIQTSLPQSNKIEWTPEAQRRDVAGFIDLTKQAYESVGGMTDLVVWPETMLPGIGLEPDTIEYARRFGPDYAHLYEFGEEVVDLSRSLGVPMLVGSPAWVGPSLDQVTLDGGRTGVRLGRRHAYNSAYLIQGEPPYQRYDKFHLTPFGEVIPYVWRWPWLEQRLLALGARGMRFELDRNPSIALLTLRVGERDLHLATPICFEDTVAGLCRRMVYDGGRKRADVLVNLSNDGWFGADDDARAQHVEAARYRAIENRVPLLRCVNTGDTVAVDSCGRVRGDVGEPGRAGWLEAAVRLDSRHTLYGRIGEVWPWTCLVLTVLLAGLTLRKDER